MKRGDLYIIHAELRTGDVLHYIGFTRHGNLSNRMRQHRKPSSHSLPQQWLRAGASLEAFVIRTNATLDDELDAQLEQPRSSLCPLCPNNDNHHA